MKKWQQDLVQVCIISAPPVSTKASGTIEGTAKVAEESSSSTYYIPKSADGNPIPLLKQRVNDQDIPLPDPNAISSNTVLGGKISSKTGEVYRQSATFPSGTWHTVWFWLLRGEKICIFHLMF